MDHNKIQSSQYVKNYKIEDLQKRLSPFGGQWRCTAMTLKR